MKKWILVSIVIILVACIYIFIPATLTISTTIISHSNSTATNRVFSDSSTWYRWWPKAKEHGLDSLNEKNLFAYKDFNYTIEKMLQNGAQVSMLYVGDSDIKSNIRIIQLNKDSCIIDWSCDLYTGFNPLKKIMTYQHAKKIKKNMTDILNSFAGYIGNQKNIYGVDFHQTMSKDSTLVSMTSISKNYPSTDEIYQLIDSLKQYVTSQGATSINYPMLNISKISGSQYKTMVAISVNRTLKGNERITIKRFVPWKMIEGLVYGGTNSVSEAFEQLNFYVEDHQNSIMAIPFQSLITDRIKEPDSTKWVTKICAPIS